MKPVLSRKEVLVRLKNRSYVISYLQYHKIYFKAIKALMYHPTSNFVSRIGENDLDIDSIFRYTWKFNAVGDIDGWSLMDGWNKYYNTKCEL